MAHAALRCLLLPAAALGWQAGLDDVASAIQAGQPPIAAGTSGRSYILHVPDPSREGFGSALNFVKPVLDAAVRQGLTYVCQEKDFRSLSHSTGMLGFLFGCHNDTYVVGDQAAYSSVKANKQLTWVNAGVNLQDTKLYFRSGREINVRTDNGPLPMNPNTVYYVDQPGLMRHHWGESYKWFRSQYQLIRKMDPARQAPKCWDEAAVRREKNTTIVLAIRRGDGNHKTKTTVFASLLNRLFDGKLTGLRVPRDKANIVIISETFPEIEHNPEFKLFQDEFGNFSSVKYFLGDSEHDETKAVPRFIRDLDCITQSDILFASKGGFGLLGAGLQKDEGVALSIEFTDFQRPDTPNAKKVPAGDLRFYRKRDAEWRMEPDELPNSFIVTPP